MSVLESRLVIAATDDTAIAFATVEARIKALQGQLATLNTGIGSVSKASAAVAPASKAVTEAVGPGAIGTVLGVASAVTGVDAVIGGYKEAVGQQHERVRQQLAGMTQQQVAEGQKLAFELAKKYPSVPQSEIMHLMRTGTTVTGDFDEAKDLMEPLTRLRVVAQAARPHASTEETTEEMDKLVKAMEIAGITQKPDLFREYIGGISKSLNAFGDQMRPSDYFEMMKYSRQAGNKLSERFLMTTMSTLGSEIGGASIGTAVASFNRAIVGGHMEHQAAVEMAGLGLFNENDLIRLKTGEVKGIKRGAHVQDWRMAQSDPDLWIKNVLMPALEKHGISSSDEVAAEVSKLFPNRTAGQFVSEVSTQGQKLAKNAENWRKAMADEAADVLAKTDINAAASGFGNRLKNMISERIPTDALATGMSSLGSLFSFLTPAPREQHGIMEDLKTDLKGFKDALWPIHIGPLGYEKWHNPDADAQRHVWDANWNARYFPGEASADMARERSRGMALSGLGSAGHAAAQDVNVTGEATVHVPISVTVTASSELLHAFDDAKNALRDFQAKMALVPNATGHTGRMDSDAAPSHATGIGHM